MTRLVRVREETGTIRDTTMSSSWGNCNGGTRRCQDILDVTMTLDHGGVQGGMSRWSHRESKTLTMNAAILRFVFPDISSKKS